MEEDKIETQSSEPQENNVSTPEQAAKETQDPKPSYWVMILFLAIFLICDGFSYCPWWMWIVVVLWIFMTIGGLKKKWQAIIGVAILIWGTPIFNDEESESYTDSGSSKSALSPSSQSSTETGFYDVSGTWTHTWSDAPGTLSGITVKISGAGTGYVHIWGSEGPVSHTLLKENVTFNRVGDRIYAKFSNGTEGKFIVKNGQLFTDKGKPYSKQ